MTQEHDAPLIDPVTIRNVRYPVGLSCAVCVVLATVLFVSSLMFLMTLGITPYVGPDVVVFLAILSTGFFTPIILLLTPVPWLVRRIRIEEKGLHRSPGRYYDLDLLQSITLVDDPHEDYADDDLPIRVARVDIKPRNGMHFTLMISEGDVDRLLVWAKQMKITVIDQRTPRGDHES